MRSLAFRVGIGSILVLIGSAQAQTPATRDIRLRWLPPENAAEAGALRYVLFRSPNGGPEERIEVGEGTETVLGFLADRSYRLQLIAIGEGGESGRSNEIELAARPPQPLPPRRFEIVVPSEGAPTIRELP